jgi:hypothetical protein
MKRSVYSALVATLVAPALAHATEIHPDVVLKDAAGVPVVESGEPVDVRQTCGGDCHDVAHIESTSYHVDPAADAPAKSRWDRGPSSTERFAPLVHQDPAPGSAEEAARDPRWVGGSDARPMNCFLCHSSDVDASARSRALQDGAFAWEAAATLAGTLVDRGADGAWRYRPELFAEDGSVKASALGLGEPTSESCQRCHGKLETEVGGAVAMRPLDDLSTAHATGFVYSGAFVHDSALNVADKAAKTRPFDVHAERLLECTDCHYSIDNPAFRAELDETRPEHLRFDGRREGVGEWVKRPSHELATGAAAQSYLGHNVRNSMRRCGDCHAAEETHAWLPYPKRHFDSLACETCHVPQIDAPILETVDWTVMTSSTSPRTVFRGPDAPPSDVDVLRPPFRPVWLNRAIDGAEKITPNNLVTQIFWVADEPEAPVSVDVLRTVFFEPDGSLQQRWVMLFDLDGSGEVERAELALTTEPQVAAVRKALEAAGVREPRIVAEVEAFGLHHGVAGKEHATKACESCHAEDAPATEKLTLARVLPPSAEVTWTSDLQAAGRLDAAGGRLSFEPDTRATGRYVLGQHRFAWVDAFGIAAVALVALGALGHASARILARRRSAS